VEAEVIVNHESDDFYGEMKVISFIEDHKVIDKIIAHLKLIFMAERPPPSQFVQKELLMAAEERGEYH